MQASSAPPKKVCVLGAGVIGLSAALRISSVRSLSVQHKDVVARWQDACLVSKSWRRALLAVTIAV